MSIGLLSRNTPRIDVRRSAVVESTALRDSRRMSHANRRDCDESFVKNA
jgi:hypothetical protein